MSEPVNAQLKRLANASPFLQRQAVYGVFQLLRKLSVGSKGISASAIATCLAQSSHPVRLPAGTCRRAMCNSAPLQTCCAART